MSGTPSQTAVFALLDEHERALQHLLTLMEGWDDEHLQHTVVGSTDTTYRDVLHHVASAAYFSYFVWIQRMLGWKIVSPPIPDREHIQRIRKLKDLCALLREITPYSRRALSALTNDHLGPARYLSNWNMPFTIDQMLEHAIVHLWRHLRQLERSERLRTQ